MEKLHEIFVYVKTHWDVILNGLVILATIIGYIIGAKKEGKKKGEIIKNVALLLINALKDDGVIEEGENGLPKIKKDKLKDVEGIAEAMVNELKEKNPKKAQEIIEAKNHVLEMIEKVNEASEKIKEIKEDKPSSQGGIKIGSHHGKPIYLEDAIEKVGKIKNIINIFRKR